MVGGGVGAGAAQPLGQAQDGPTAAVQDAPGHRQQPAAHQGVVGVTVLQRGEAKPASADDEQVDLLNN